MNKKKLALPREATAIGFLAALFLGIGCVNPAFLSPANIMLCLNSSVVYTIVAMGIAFVIITGEIDVSVGATLGIAAAVCGSFVRDGYAAQGILAALAVGLAIGLVNAFGVAFLRVPSIIMTLGINGIVRGLVYVYTDGKWVENIPFEFKSLSLARAFGSLTWFYFAALLCMAAGHLILSKTNRGRQFAAVGDNPNGATLLGISVRGTKTLAFVLSSLFAAIGGILFVSRVGFVTPIAGDGYEMRVIAACVLGGISLSGGVGSLIGAAVGASIMASISRILVFLGLPSDYDNTITGVLLIVIVVSDAVIQSRSSEKLRKERLAARVHGASTDAKEAAK